MRELSSEEGRNTRPKLSLDFSEFWGEFYFSGAVELKKSQPFATLALCKVMLLDVPPRLWHCLHF